MAMMSLRDRIVAAVGGVPIDHEAQTELLFSLHDGSYDSRSPDPIPFVNGSAGGNLYVALRDDVRVESDLLDVFTDGVYEALQNVHKLGLANNVLVYGRQLIDKDAHQKAYRLDIVDDGPGFNPYSAGKIFERYELLRLYKQDPVAHRHLWPMITDVGEDKKRTSGGVGMPMSIFCAKDVLGGRFVLGNADPDYWSSEVDTPCEFKGALVHMVVPIDSIRQFDSLVAGDRPTVHLRRPHDTDRIVREVLGAVYSDAS